MSTAAKRKAITIQFTPGKDDDLLTCIEAMPDGQRNMLLKQALRDGLLNSSESVEAQRLVQLERELLTLRQSLEDMPDWLDHRFNAVQQAISNATVMTSPAPQATEPIFKLSAEEKARRMANLNHAAW